MKNKFLLLGATALLSTGALMANADEVNLGASGYKDSADFRAHVELIKAAGITIIDDLVNFGRLVQTDADAPTGTVTMDRYGAITLSGSGVVRDTAVATHAGGFDLNIPEGYEATVTPDESVLLMNENEDDITFTPTVTHNGFLHIEGSDYIMHRYYVHGSLDLDDVPFNGAYEGSFHVSVIVQPE